MEGGVSHGFDVRLERRAAHREVGALGFETHLRELIRLGERRDDVGELASLGEGAGDVRIGDEVGDALETPLRPFECGGERRALSLFEFTVELREDAGPVAEVVVDKRLGDTGAVRESRERELARTGVPDQVACRVEQLRAPLRLRHSPPHGAGSLRNLDPLRRCPTR